MTEHQRIEQLAEKLSHSLIDIRLRSAQNLLSKIENGIIANRILSSKNCAESLVTGISRCFEKFNLEFSTDLDKEFFITLLKIIKHICISNLCTSPLIIQEYSYLLDCLYKLSSVAVLGDVIIQRVEETIQVIFSIQPGIGNYNANNSNNRTNSNDNNSSSNGDNVKKALICTANMNNNIIYNSNNINNNNNSNINDNNNNDNMNTIDVENYINKKYQTATILISNNIFKTKNNADKENNKDNQNNQYNHDGQDNQNSKNTNYTNYTNIKNNINNIKHLNNAQDSYHSGAGAIFYSPLVYEGWKFPSFIVTESEEKFLFDLEVKIKMNHTSSVILLWEVLSDFPPHVLLSRQGMLQALFDILGAGETGLHQSNGGDCVQDLSE